MVLNASENVSRHIGHACESSSPPRWTSDAASIASAIAFASCARGVTAARRPQASNFRVTCRRHDRSQQC
eukprot:30998-Pelagococcus_subviridis.AAC.4